MAKSPRQSKKKIGLLNSGTSAALKVPMDWFSQGVEQALVRKVGLGLAKKDVEIISKYANHDLGKLATLASGLIQKDGVQLLVATGGLASAEAAINAVNSARSNMPVVYVSGLTPSSRTSKATGVITDTTACLPQRLKHARTLLGDSRKIHLLVRSGTKIGKSEKDQLSSLTAIEADKTDLEEAFKKASDAKIALLVSSDPYFTSERKRIVGWAKKYKVPAIYAWKDYVEIGGLMSFGPSLSNAYRRAGVYAAQIVNEQQASPPELKASHNEICLNLKTAGDLDITVPPELLAKADYVM
jgi:putative ABC transport system substrate-binding protein